MWGAQAPHFNYNLNRNKLIMYTPTQQDIDNFVNDYTQKIVQHFERKFPQVKDHNVQVVHNFDITKELEYYNNDDPDSYSFLDALAGETKSIKINQYPCGYKYAVTISEDEQFTIVIEDRDIDTPLLLQVIKILLEGSYYTGAI